jgi:peptidoglycan hydrolase CwlO-like protein
MFKKLIIGTGTVVVLAVVFVGPAALTHVKQAFGWVRNEIKDAVPVEYQLEQAEATIDEIIPEIEACKRVVAQEQVEIKYLENDIAKLSTEQEKDTEILQAHNASLKSGQPVFYVAGRSYSRTSMERELRLALRKLQTNESLLESKRRLLEARQRSLEAAKQKLGAVCAEKDNLKIAVEQLRAQLRETQALEATSSRFHLDDTRLAEVKDLLTRVRKRLDIAQQLIENDAGAAIDLPEVSTEATSVTVEIDRYLGDRRPNGATVALPLAGKDAVESN